MVITRARAHTHTLGRLERHPFGYSEYFFATLGKRYDSLRGLSYQWPPTDKVSAGGRRWRSFCLRRWRA